MDGKMFGKFTASFTAVCFDLNWKITFNEKRENAFNEFSLIREDVVSSGKFSNFKII